VSISPESCTALVLNADFRPLSYFPLSLWSWQDAIKAVFLERVHVVSEYDEVVHSSTEEYRLPSVISLKNFVANNRRPVFTRFNVFLRDRFTCQYCNIPKPIGQLTFDHIIPRSQGGDTTWTNIATACSECNLAKSNMTASKAGLTLNTKPVVPSARHLQRNGSLFPPNYLHHSWRDFLYWDTELANSDR
jgi:5-methylcytosine-specific restriction endonuclease McrA